MTIISVRCIKEFCDDLIHLSFGNEYDGHLYGDGGLLIFVKDGWFKLTDWEEYIEVIPK